MKSNTLVSVIIPTYNSEKYIRECLDAIVSQTYKNLEIIIVDNLSSDSTIDICNEYASNDNRIKVIINPDKGVSISRNCGIQNANGDFVVFCDSDDYPDKDMIESCVDAYDSWEDNKTPFIVCGMYFDNVINKNVDSTISVLGEEFGYSEGDKYLLPRRMVAALSWIKLFNFVTNKFYDLNLIKQNSVRFNESINIGEDLEFNLDYLDACNGDIGMINRPLYHYIKRATNSLSLSYHENDLEDTKHIYDRLIKWEEKQEGTTSDDIVFLKAIYVTDWISRITTCYEYFKGTDKTIGNKISKELRCRKFREMLEEVYKAKRISTLRYLCLKTGRYEVFYFFRGIYQIMKG